MLALRAESILEPDGRGLSWCVKVDASKEEWFEMEKTQRRLRAMLAAAALTHLWGLISAVAPVANAQDATPSAPIVVCSSPGLHPPGEPSAATPTDMGGMVMASPVAEAGTQRHDRR